MTDKINDKINGWLDKNLPPKEELTDEKIQEVLDRAVDFPSNTEVGYYFAYLVLFRIGHHCGLETSDERFRKRLTQKCLEC